MNQPTDKPSEPDFLCDAWSRRVHQCDKQCDGCFRRQYEAARANAVAHALDNSLDPRNRLQGVVARLNGFGWQQSATAPQEWNKVERRKDKWTLITAEESKRIGRRFKDQNGREFGFFGIVDGYDDYYYGMYSKEHGMALLSCVGGIDAPGHGWTEVQSKSLEDEERERYEARMLKRATAERTNERKEP